MTTDSTIYVAGAQTLIGSALVRALRKEGHARLCEPESGEPDLTSPSQVEAFFKRHRPSHVFVAAGQSGGIAANQKYPADLIYNNLVVATNVIEAAHRHGVSKLLFLGSSCMYPRLAPQPLKPEYLLTGELEPTNEAYAVAKIAGMKMCQSYRRQFADHFIVGIPANSFGPGDDFSPEDSHVVAALIRRMHEAKIEGRPSTPVWGSGAARREFVYVDDLASACIAAMKKYDGIEPINLGGGQDVSIRELAEEIGAVVGFTGKLEFDASKPDGMPRKGLDGSVLAGLGFKLRWPLRDALAATYAWYEQHQAAKVIHA